MSEMISPREIRSAMIMPPENCVALSAIMHRQGNVRQRSR
jgi:hypothetical protein